MVWHAPSGQPRQVTAGAGGTILMWDPAIGRQVGIPLMGYVGTVEDLMLLTTRYGDSWLASVGQDHTIRIWDPLQGRMTYQLQALDYTETIVALRHGTLAVGLDDGWALLQLPDGI